LPLHHWHAARGARFRENDGWQFPAYYSEVESEVAAARTVLALVDVSAFAKISLLGRGVPDMVQTLLGHSPATKPRGVARLTTGGPCWACRLTLDHLLLLPFTTRAAGAMTRLAEISRSPGVVQTDVTSANAGFGLAGPHREKLLSQLTPLDVSEAALPVGACAETSLAGVQALLVPWSEPPVAGVWIYVSWDVAEYVWDMIMDRGGSLGIMPLGLDGLCALCLSR
jgi:heterotetrameric sarcosine oxidase gamma subunit